jgi:hypothetical protein
MNYRIFDFNLIVLSSTTNTPYPRWWMVWEQSPLLWLAISDEMLATPSMVFGGATMPTTN